MLYTNFGDIFLETSGKKWTSRTSRDMEEKKRNRNSSPVTFEQERDDAIAELDNVIESYRHQRGGVGGSSIGGAATSTTGILHGTVRRKSKHQDKNGGTWPKARFVIYN